MIFTDLNDWLWIFTIINWEKVFVTSEEVVKVKYEFYDLVIENWEKTLIKTNKTLELEQIAKDSQKIQILEKLWQLTNQKAWMVELWLDITEITQEIENLKNTFNYLY